MNIKNASNYTIGLDLGTGSVGWAVTDENGELYSRHGTRTLGVRLFPSAETASATRLKRGQRRRYDRRRQRLDYLQSLFSAEMDKVDPEFFIRLRQSALIPADRTEAFAVDERHALFNGSDFTESKYYCQFPTIWHLRKHLMESDEPADIRLVYLALHNIVKYRGNFLREDEAGITARNANAASSVEKLIQALTEYADMHEDLGVSFSADEDGLRAALDAKGLSNADRVQKLENGLHLSDGKRAKLIARACIGYKVEFSNLFLGLEKGEGANFAVSDDEKIDAFLSVCPDDAQPLFEAIRAAYSAYVLSSILGGAPSLSDAMIASYKRHKEDLTVVKALVKDYLGMDAYRKMFRGPKTPTGDYDINKLPKGSYTAYIAGEKLANGKGCTYEDFIKSLRKLLASSAELIADERYEKIKDRLEADDGEFLAKQKTRANGAIPFQLHLEEMDAIIKHQGQFHPFLLERCVELEKLVSSRIPYYVGPLNAGRDPDEFYPGNTVDHTRKFAWSVRRPGMEHAKAYPWNVEEVIDIDETAERFIRRMTGTCTYLYGEPVLPRCSLLYEEFCVLNELNSARWCDAGGTPHRFDWADREAVVEELFQRRKTVSHKVVADWLRQRETVLNPQISGTQGETAFESKLNSYNDFCKILEVDRLEDAACPLTLWDIDQIILWNTVFEDRAILKRKLEQNYGEVLRDDQIKKIVKKRYTGWGRLSEKLLTGIKIDTPMGPMNIMGILRHGDPTTGHHRQAMNLMEVLRSKDFGFEERIDELNEAYFEHKGTLLSVDDMQGSPALRRSVNQAMRIIEEIVHITGEQPARICIEVTRDDDLKKKGKRANTRYQKLVDAMAKLKGDAAEFDPEVAKQLKASKDDLDNRRLVLYFLQNGKSLYSGRPLDINQLSTYEVDHIIPQCYTKDDSFDNLALVRKEENQRKLDSLLLDAGIIGARRAWWQALKNAGLMSEKKFRNLTCTNISDRMLKGFINRQLVETSQIVKFVRQMCEQRYPGTKIVSVRASLGHSLRERCKLTKCREFNNYHHAHDAYIACEVARFIEYRYPKWQDGFNLAIVRKYAESLGKGFAKTGKIPGESGFIIDSFLRDGFDKETGEVFKDAWDASAVVSRIRTVMGYKKIFITRMLEEQTGALWDETIYSPRDASHGKNLAMPRKGFGTDNPLDPKTYGGFNNVQRAYFFAFRAKDYRDEWRNFFEGIPIHLVDRVTGTAEDLLSYANRIAADNKCHDAQILRAKIPLRQKFEFEKCTYYLHGKVDARNYYRPAKEIVGDVNFAGRISQAVNCPEALGPDERTMIISGLATRGQAACPSLANALNIAQHLEAVVCLEDREFSKMVIEITGCYKADQNSCNLTAIGRPASSGRMKMNFASMLEHIVWIDESITGMYSHRTTYQDMINGL